MPGFFEKLHDIEGNVENYKTTTHFQGSIWKICRRLVRDTFRQSRQDRDFPWGFPSPLPGYRYLDNQGCQGQ